MTDSTAHQYMSREEKSSSSISCKFLPILSEAYISQWGFQR